MQGVESAVIGESGGEGGGGSGEGKLINTDLKSEEHVVEVLAESAPKCRPHDAARCPLNQRGQIQHQLIFHVDVRASRRPI